MTFHHQKHSMNLQKHFRQFVQIPGTSRFQHRYYKGQINRTTFLIDIHLTLVEVHFFSIRETSGFSPQQESNIEAIIVKKMHSNTNGTIGCPTEKVLPNMLQPDSLMRSSLADTYNNAEEHLESNIYKKNNTKMRSPYAKIYVEIYFLSSDFTNINKCALE